MWSMKTILFGLLVLFVIIFLVKLTLPENSKEPKPGISNEAVSTTNESIQEINIIAKEFSFSPRNIRLSLNKKVRFRITSDDVTHGFSLPELGIDQVIEPGKETVIDFQPTKKGTFTLLCSVACGVGHTGMKGSIIIE